MSRKAITFSIDEKLVEKLKTIAFHSKKTQRELIEEAIREMTIRK